MAGIGCLPWQGSTASGPVTHSAHGCGNSGCRRASHLQGQSASKHNRIDCPRLKPERCLQPESVAVATFAPVPNGPPKALHQIVITWVFGCADCLDGSPMDTIPPMPMIGRLPISRRRLQRHLEAGNQWIAHLDLAALYEMISTVPCRASWCRPGWAGGVAVNFASGSES
jgi:hypothetical protein